MYVYMYHAVGNDYLNNFWEYFIQKELQNIFLYSGRPEYFRQFSVR